MLHISLFIPNLNGGGAERVTAHLASALADRGYPVDLVLVEAKGPFLADLSKNVRVVNLRSRRVITSILPLARYLRTEKPDVLVSALSHANIAAFLAKRLSKASTHIIPTIHSSLSMHEAHHTGIRALVIRFAIRRCYPWADAIVAVSRGVADDLVRTTGVSRSLVRVVYNPVISPRMKELASEPVNHPWFAPGQPKMILGVGSLRAPKDFPTLIRAFAHLRRDCDVRLLILGDGPDRSELEQLVKEMDLTQHVSLPGFAKNPFAYMTKSSLFVLSSAWEGLSMVLVEALALGVPVVSTDCNNGPREILHDGKYGRLVPVRDVAALANAMRDTLSEPSREVPEEALQPYTLQAAADGYIRVIEEVFVRSRQK